MILYAYDFTLQIDRKAGREREIEKEDIYGEREREREIEGIIDRSLRYQPEKWELDYIRSRIPPNEKERGREGGRKKRKTISKEFNYIL